MTIQEVFPVDVVRNDEVAVDGRTLLVWVLGHYPKNFTRDIEKAINRCGLIENVDYQVLRQSEECDSKGLTNIEYVFKASSAKKIAMSARGEKANEVRDYFLQCEAVARYISEESKYIPQTPESVALEEWKHNANCIMEIATMCGYSDVAKKRMAIEAGYNIEVRNEVSIVPEHMERDFLLGVDNVESEGVAKLEFGGKVLSPTQVGEFFNKTATDVNNALVDLGFQTKFKLGNATYYMPTPRAEMYCTTLTSKNKKLKTDYVKINGWKIKLIFDKLEIYFKDN